MKKSTIQKAVEAEREACAKVAESNSYGPWSQAAQAIAKKIRDRFKKEE